MAAALRAARNGNRCGPAAEDEEKRISQWVKQALREVASRQQVKEQRIDDGIKAVEKLETTLRKKLSKVRNTLLDRLKTLENVDSESARLEAAKALAELRAVEDRTDASIKDLRTRGIGRAIEERRFKSASMGLASSSPSSATASVATPKSCSSVQADAMFAEMRAKMMELQSTVSEQRGMMQAQASELMNLKEKLIQQPVTGQQKQVYAELTAENVLKNANYRDYKPGEGKTRWADVETPPRGRSVASFAGH